MEILLLVLGGLLLNCIIGAVVLACIDDDRQSLLQWYCECPLPGFGHTLVLTVWPLVAFAWLRGRQA